MLLLVVKNIYIRVYSYKYFFFTKYQVSVLCPFRIGALG